MAETHDAKPAARRQRYGRDRSPGSAGSVGFSREEDQAWTVDALSRFALSRDRVLRNEIVERHRWLAVMCAQRYANRGEPLEDLVQVGLVGIVKAVERFDVERGRSFVAFAVPTVTGEIKRHFRNTSWAVHVPRHTKELCMMINGTVSDLTQTLRRPPTVQEIAESIGESTDAVLQAMEAGAGFRTTSLDPQRSSRGKLDSRMLASENALTSQSLLALLSPRHRELVELRFFEDLSQREIAKRIGLSQVHVSRLLREAFTLLRRHLDDELDLDPEH